MDNIYLITGATGYLNEDYETWTVTAFKTFKEAEKYVKLLEHRAAEIIEKIGGKYQPYNPVVHGSNEYDSEMEIIGGHVYYYLEEVGLFNTVEDIL